MVIATLLWGGTFVAIRDSVARIDPIALVAIRFLVAGAIALLLALVTRRRFDGDALRGGALAGVLFAAGFAFQAIGLDPHDGRDLGVPHLDRIADGGVVRLAAARPAAGSRALARCRARRGRDRAARRRRGTAPRGRRALDVARRGGVRAPDHRGRAVRAACRSRSRWSRCRPARWPAILLPISWARWPAFRALDATDAARLIYLIVAGSLVAPWLQIVAQTSLPASRIGLLFTLEPVFALIVALTLGAERFPWRWWWGPRWCSWR